MSGSSDPNSPSPFHGHSPPGNMQTGNLPPVPATDFSTPITGDGAGDYHDATPEGVPMNGPPIAPHHMGGHAYPPGTMAQNMGPYFTNGPYPNAHTANGGMNAPANAPMFLGPPAQYGQVGQPQGGYNDQRRQSGDNHMLEEDQDEAENRPAQGPKKATRACDACRRKKIKCSGGEPGVQACRPCAKDDASLCGYQRTPQKRGPNKGYIQELKDDLQRTGQEQKYERKINERQFAQLQRASELQIRFWLDTQATLKQIELRLGTGTAEEMEKETKKRKIALLSGVEDSKKLMDFSIDEQVSIGKFKSELQTFFPLLPKDASQLGDITDQGPKEVKQAFLYALKATTNPLNAVEDILAAATILAQVADMEQVKAGSLCYLQANILAAIAILAVGPGIPHHLPKASTYLDIACKQHEIQALQGLTPKAQPKAFAGGVNYEYNKAARATSLTLRCLLMFYALGFGVEFPLAHKIEAPGHGDRAFIAAETMAFFEILSPIGEFLADNTSNSLLAKLKQAKKQCHPKYHALFDALDLAQSRVNDSQGPDFAQKASAKATALAGKIFEVSADQQTFTPVTPLYFHPLAITLLTLVDLQKPAVDPDTNREATRVFATLVQEAAKVGKQFRTGWEHGVHDVAEWTYPDATSMGHLDAPLEWAKPINDGYLSFLFPSEKEHNLSWY